MALAVLLLAEGLVRLSHSALATPMIWPAPELQKKYDQIVARAASRQPTDVVLVGDSMMDAGGDPGGVGGAGTGVAGGVYNASVAGETLPTIADWTTRVVVPRLHPKVVVVGFSSNELNPRLLLPASGVAAYRHSRAVRSAEGIGSPVDRADAFLRHWSLLYRYRTVLRNPFAHVGPQDPLQAGIFDPALTAAGQDLAFVSQRYLQTGGTDRARLVINGVIAALRGFRVSPDNLAILKGMLTSLRSQGIQVLLVAMPVTADLVSFHPAGTTDYQAALASFVSVAQASDAGIAVPGVWPTSEFADPVHLNGAGTVHFSKYLAPLVRHALALAGAGRAP